MKHLLTIVAILTVFLAGCGKFKKPEQIKAEADFKLLEAPDWSVNANIYEVNIRQYTPEGTFNAFAGHLPRLKEMGVDILWLMPIHPISVKNRKGSLGSYYAAQDYKAINPNFGTEADFKALVARIHELGMKIILDWVPNHTGADHVWTKTNPEFYTKDSLGNITHPKDTDWTDVADLNYDNPEMRKAMTDAMLYWITDFDIDGYRCDVAGFVPNDFWETNIKALFAKKHVFMLAEWEDPKLHDVGFHMTYAWGFHHLMKEVAQQKKSVSDILAFFKDEQAKFKPADYRMAFIDNHDENSWNGTMAQRFGKAVDLMAVFAFTSHGMPLMYSGQEAGLNKTLKFFEKDSIDWKYQDKTLFYKTLLALKRNNKALWNGVHGGPLNIINTDNPDKVLVYEREKDGEKVLVALNMSDKKQFFKTAAALPKAEMNEIFQNKKMDPSAWNTQKMELKPWSYIVLSSK